jgi:predicted Zn-dependent protease
VTLAPQAGCPARARLARSDQPRAFADGRYAIMTTRFVPFLRNEEELAVVLAHEVAHNILGHPAALEAQGVPQGRGRGSRRNATLVRASEEAADRLSIRLLDAAGYDVAAAIPLWRRVYARFGSAGAAHLSLRDRESIISEAIAMLRSENRAFTRQR